MANGHRNTVPLGQVGTGAAYVLGPNLALQQWMGNVQQQQNIRLQAEQHNAQINRQNYDAFNRQLSQLQPSSGMFSSDINSLIAEHVNKGAELMSRGVNPYAPDYSNPDAVTESQNFLQEENYIKSAQGLLQQYEKQRSDALKEYNKDPTAFDYESFMSLMEFEKNNTVADVISGVATLPNLERTFDMGSFVKNNIGVPKTSAARYERGDDGRDYLVKESGVDAERLLENVVSSFKTGRGANYLNQQLRLAGIDGDASGIIGTVDPEELRVIIDQELRSPYPGNPVANLILEGSIPSFNSPEYERFLDAAVTEQLRAEQVASRVFNQAAQAALGQAGSSVEVSPTWDLVKEARAARGEARSIRASQRAEESHQKRMSNEKQRSTFASDISNQDSDAIRDLRVSVEMNGGRLTKADAATWPYSPDAARPDTWVIELPPRIERRETTDDLGDTQITSVSVPRRFEVKLDGTRESQRQVLHVLNELRGIDIEDRRIRYSPGSTDDLQGFFEEDPLLDFFK